MDAGLDEDTIGGVFAGSTGRPSGRPSRGAGVGRRADDPAIVAQRRDVDDLHRHFTAEQLIELTLDVMKWNAQKVAVALGIDNWIRPGELSDLRFDEQGNWVRPEPR